MAEKLGWEGKSVRHADGRTGVISAESTGFLHVGLRISVDGGKEACVQLNTNGKDTGEPGWSWYCPRFGDKQAPAWLPLGDHNDFGATVLALSEPQEGLIRRMAAGASLRHDTNTGLFRLKEATTTRTIHPATVESLLRHGAIMKSFDGACRLTA